MKDELQKDKNMLNSLKKDKKRNSLYGLDQHDIIPQKGVICYGRKPNKLNISDKKILDSTKINKTKYERYNQIMT